jgi:hypothetical protein
MYWQQGINAGEIKPATVMVSNDKEPIQTLIVFSPVFGDQIAQLPDQEFHFDVFSPGALRNDTTAIQRLCHSLRPETKKFLLSCR